VGVAFDALETAHNLSHSIAIAGLPNLTFVGMPSTPNRRRPLGATGGAQMSSHLRRGSD